ncbi:MAG: hypothetical protein IPH75_12210 [bacterium]|nr:hypothetical protein [bacterium]
MQLPLLILSFLFLLTGLVLRVMMRAYRSEAGKAIGWFSLRGWFVPWSSVDYLTPVGQKMHVASLACIMFGIFLYMWVRTMP